MNQGYNDGYPLGYEDGEVDGDIDGWYDGEDDGADDGYEDGFDDGYDNEYIFGDIDGYNDGYDDGYEDRFIEGYDIGYTDGYNQGYLEWEADQKSVKSLVEKSIQAHPPLSITSNTSTNIFYKITNDIKVTIPLLSTKAEEGKMYKKGFAEGRRDARLTISLN